MNLDEITPLVLTYNEAPNIEACLDSLSWAREILVLDSGSTDQTALLASRFSNARVLQRAFDSHANQWNFGCSQAGIATPWILSMDADYRVTKELRQEIEAVKPTELTSAFEMRFRYCIFGKQLRGSLYPPSPLLFLRDRCRFRQVGHTQRLDVSAGEVVPLHSYVLHDDRKSVSRWLQSQSNYMDLERAKLASSKPSELRVRDSLRRWILPAPFMALFYALFVRGVILDGKSGLFYALQRFVAELILSLKLLEQKLNVEDGREQSETARRRTGSASL